MTRTIKSGEEVRVRGCTAESGKTKLHKQTRLDTCDKPSLAGLSEGAVRAKAVWMNSMDMIDARAKARRDVTTTVSRQARGSSGHASSSEDDMNIGVIPKPVQATAAARKPYCSPLLDGAKRANQPSVFLISRPTGVGTAGSNRSKTTGGSQQRQAVEVHRKQILQRAHSVAPLPAYTSTAQPIPSSSKSQKEKSGQKGELAHLGLIALGNRCNKGEPERVSRSASAGDLNHNSGVVDLESREENTRNVRVPPRIAQRFPLDGVKAPPRAPASSQESSPHVSQSKAKGGSRLDQENEGGKKRITKVFPLSDASAARSKQQYPLLSVEIPSRPVASSSNVESHSSSYIQEEFSLVAEDTPPRTLRPFPLGTPSQPTASSGSKRPSSEPQEGSPSPSQRIRLSKQRVFLCLLQVIVLIMLIEQSTIGLVLYRG